jgi:hypothetical protein
MRYERCVSLAAVLVLSTLTLAGGQLTTGWAEGATGLLVVRDVSGISLVGGVDDCTNLNSGKPDTCPATPGNNCFTSHTICNAATTGQTKIATCTDTGGDVCQGTQGLCAAGKNRIPVNGGCNEVTVAE